MSFLNVLILYRKQGKFSSSTEADLKEKKNVAGNLGSKIKACFWLGASKLNQGAESSFDLIKQWDKVIKLISSAILRISTRNDRCRKRLV